MWDEIATPIPAGFGARLHHLAVGTNPVESRYFQEQVPVSPPMLLADVRRTTLWRPGMWASRARTEGAGHRRRESDRIHGVGDPAGVFGVLRAPCPNSVIPPQVSTARRVRNNITLHPSSPHGSRRPGRSPRVSRAPQVKRRSWAVGPGGDVGAGSAVVPFGGLVGQKVLVDLDVFLFHPEPEGKQSSSARKR